MGSFCLSYIFSGESSDVSICIKLLSYYISIFFFFLNIGNQRIDNTNSSMNNAERVSGICIDYPISFTSSHCTFSNNKVSGYSCIDFCSNSGTITYANIFHNNSPSLGVVSVESSGSRKMMNCIFKNN